MSKERFSVDTVVIGAGVVGLAIARELALTGREVWVLERHDGIGSETSSRNSEVIHAGIYYPPGSLKAQLCVAGKRLLYDYLQQKYISHQRLGKLIVATSKSQEQKLEQLRLTAEANGVDDMVWLDRDALLGFEPDLASCTSALFSPSTGIVDSHGLMLALLGDIESSGGFVVTRSPVNAVHRHDAGFEVDVGGASPCFLEAAELINSAGLEAHVLAASIEGLPDEYVPDVRYAKGHYFACSKKVPFKHLVYPVPEPGGLGVHLTLDLAGGARFGPDVQWIDSIDYTFDDSRREQFIQSIRRYWPALPEAAFHPDYTGIRPKLCGPGGVADFRIDGPGEHGVQGLVNLFGIESPGLTSCLAIARHVAAQLR